LLFNHFDANLLDSNVLGRLEWRLASGTASYSKR